MDAKINIAKILKDKPQGTKLYSSACGKCELKEADDKSFKVSFYSSKFGFMNGGEGTFDKNGNLYDDGECIIFPSKEMRDWSKFAWKKGDVLVNKDGDVHIIFERFVDDTYCSFVGKYYLWKENNDTEHFYKNERLLTSDFQKAGKDAAQTYINAIEKRLGGKLNRETLEIEKAQPEFKDGDIVVTDAVPSLCYSKCIFILKGDLNTGESRANSYVFFNINNNHISYDVLDTIERDRNIHLATEEEKKQLFDAIEKDGKAWDAEKKQIVDLKPKCEFKPFDRCIWKIRNCEGSIWQASFVSYVDEYGATPMGMSIDEDLVNLIILPYNDQTKLLVGTTDEWEGGEQ